MDSQDRPRWLVSSVQPLRCSRRCRKYQLREERNGDCKATAVASHVCVRTQLVGCLGHVWSECMCVPACARGCARLVCECGFVCVRAYVFACVCTCICVRMRASTRAWRFLARVLLSWADGRTKIKMRHGEDGLRIAVFALMNAFGKIFDSL